jgi:tetratricopeptide (TPR) repeat protein
MFVFAVLFPLLGLSAAAQQAPPMESNGSSIRGRVADPSGKPVVDAQVRLEEPGGREPRVTVTDSEGAFIFRSVPVGSYILTAEKLGTRSESLTVHTDPRESKSVVDLVIAASDSSSQAPPAMEFADKPNFTIAGVTDWTAAGGHGSDSILRTSEAMTRETLALNSSNGGNTGATVGDGVNATNESENELRANLANAPSGFETNRRLGEFYLHAGRYQDAVPLLQISYRIDPENHENEYQLALALKGADDAKQARLHVGNLLLSNESGELHRLAGELDEKLGDPVAAVHDYQEAVRLDPSEQNYFDWGSELLLHRAVFQSQDIFEKGIAAFPSSERLRAALGTALFAGARYEEAAQKLCEASDLNPRDAEPYLLIGKIEIASPNPLPCVEDKLSRFLKQEPRSAVASYLYAMAILKGQAQPADEHVTQQAEALLRTAISIDGSCSDAYLQLGILAASRNDFAKAIEFYAKATETNPELAEAHYRLGVAYDRVGESKKAKDEFQLHDEIRKRQAAAVERQRKEIKQFLVVAPPPAAVPASR